MINSADEFISLINSSIETDRNRAITDKASESVWEDVILKHPDYEIFVLQNETTSSLTMNMLSKSKNWKTRHGVAKKRKSGTKILTYLSNDEDPIVRQAIASNQKTPYAILKKLCLDTDDRVSRVANYNIKLRSPKQTPGN
ncbi:HEAT repeat domain-containing protein [Pseudomonas sp. IT-P291]|uniref:HEAT repeat domain-containing protein n=1 Tax=Pseudomonas sp. IT-P291 TaxID=3026448 RepID=UPI0039E0A1FF